MREFPSRKRRANLSQLGPCGMGSSRAHAPNPPAIRLEPRRSSVRQPRRGRAVTSPGSYAHHNGLLAAADPSGVSSGGGDTFQHDGTPAGFAVHRMGGRSTPQGLVVGNPRNPRGSLGTRRPIPPPAETTAPTQRRPALPLWDFRSQISDPSSVSPTLPLCDLRGSEGWPHSEEAGQSARAPLGLWLSICAHRRHLRFPLL